MLRRPMVCLMLSALIVSCSDSTDPDDLLGTWRLETVSGQPLPYILEQDGVFKVELTGETLTLAGSGRQTMVTSFRVTDGANVFTESVPAPGSYTVTGSTLTLTFDNDTDTYTAIVNGELMTIEDLGLSFVYRRE